MPAVPANKPRDKVIHLPAPRASLGTADKIPSTNLVAKAPVKFIFQKMNTAILVWFIMTSGKNHSGCSRRQEWHWSTPGLDVPGLIPLLNHSVLKSEARHHSFHAVRLRSLKKNIFLKQLSAYLNKSDCEIYWMHNRWLALKPGSRTHQGDGHTKCLSAVNYGAWVQGKAQPYLQLLPLHSKKKTQPSTSQIWCKTKSLIQFPGAEPLNCSICYMTALH